MKQKRVQWYTRLEQWSQVSQVRTWYEHNTTTAVYDELRVCCCFVAICIWLFILRTRWSKKWRHVHL